MDFVKESRAFKLNSIGTPVKLCTDNYGCEESETLMDDMTHSWGVIKETLLPTTEKE